MADLKTTQEAAAAALDGTELLRGVQSGGNVKMTTQAIADLGYDSPTTAKGDLIVHGSGVDARLPVGTDGTQLVADSTQTLGVKWYDAVGAYATSLASTIGGTLLSWIQSGTGAVIQTLQATLRERVSITQYGAVMNVSTSGQRTANSAALLAALAINGRVRIPAGTLWLAAGTALTGFWNITGEGAESTFIKGDGDLLSMSTADNGEMRVIAHLTILNDVTPGKLFKNVGTTNRVAFHFVNFGAANYHAYSSGGDAVSWHFHACRFNGATIESRHFEGLWAYTETGACYTWYCGVGMRCTNGNVVGANLHGSIFEQNNSSGIVLEATSTSFEVDGFHLFGGHFEVNGKTDNAADVQLLTSAATRIRNVTLNGVGLFTPTTTQTFRVSTSAGGGGNIFFVNLEDVCCMGAVPLCTDTAAITTKNIYYQSVSAPVNVLVFPQTPQSLSNWLGQSTTAGANAGSSATVATITPPAGTKMIDFTVQGDFYNGVANTHTGYLIGKYVLSGNRIVVLADVNNSSGTAQGFVATWTGSALQIANKASLSFNQSGDVTCVFHG